MQRNTLANIMKLMCMACHTLVWLDKQGSAQNAGQFRELVIGFISLRKMLDSPRSLGGSPGSSGHTWPGGESSCNVLGFSYVMPTCGCKLQKALPH